jgi:hypothetical protein
MKECQIVHTRGKSYLTKKELLCIIQACERFQLPKFVPSIDGDEIIGDASKECACKHQNSNPTRKLSYSHLLSSVVHLS